MHSVLMKNRKHNKFLDGREKGRMYFNPQHLLRSREFQRLSKIKQGNIQYARDRYAAVTCSSSQLIKSPRR